MWPQIASLRCVPHHWGACVCVISSKHRWCNSAGMCLYHSRVSNRCRNLCADPGPSHIVPSPRMTGSGWVTTR
jgi:hypothetical protein